MKKRVLCAFVVLAVVYSIAFADMREDCKGIKISGGEDHTLVLTKDNKLWGCGNNSYYQLGIGDTKDDQKLLVQVHGANDVGYLTDINNMDAGWQHSIALDNEDFVWAWGNNNYGQIGNNRQYDDEDTPVQVHSGDQNNGLYLVDITAVAAGRSGNHSLAVDCNEHVFTWGYNSMGQLGIGNYYQQLEPVQVVGGNGIGVLENMIAVSAGEDNSIGLETDGNVWTWGNNSNGQLGDGTVGDDSNTPVQVVSGEQDTCDANSFLCRIVAIDSGWDHLIALEEYDPCGLLDPNGDPNYGLGYVYTWGRNDTGQCGNGESGQNEYEPVKVLSGEQDPCNIDSYLKNIVAVSAGEAHSMALDFFGNVWCWGFNEILLEI